MTDPHVLLLDADASRKDVARVVHVVSPRVTERRSLGEVPQEERFDLVVLDHDSLPEDERARALQRFAGGEEAARLLVCIGPAGRDSLAELFTRYGLTNVLARTGAVDGPELLVTLRKILRQDVFGIEKYFPWGAEVQTLSVARASERFAVIEQAAAFAARAGAQARFMELFQGAADELVTNAIYDAPVDEAGRARFASRSRTEEVELAPGERIEVRFCTDGDRVGISVADPFGALEPSTVVSYLGKCFRRGADQVDEKEGGAGLGLYVVFESLSQFVVNIAPKERTEVIGLLDLRFRYKEFASRAKSFNVFVRSGER